MCIQGDCRQTLILTLIFQVTQHGNSCMEKGKTANRKKSSRFALPFHTSSTSHSLQEFLDSFNHPVICVSTLSQHNTFHSFPLISSLTFPNSLSITCIISFLSLACFNHSSITYSTISSSPMSPILHILLWD